MAFKASRQLRAFLPLFSMFLFASVVADAVSFRLDAETGVAFNTINTVRIPGDTGTKFSITDDLDVDPAFITRIRFGVQITKKQEVSLLLAPLTLYADGESPAPINFNGKTFPANEPLDARYQFNSWRLTWRWFFSERGERWETALGFTAKVRDAAIEINGGGVHSINSNIGFVPLLNFYVHYRLGNDWTLLLDGDALAAPQGRAEDVFIGAMRRVGTDATARAGYRVIEGGADNEIVYTFALLHFVVIGLDVRF